MSEQQSKMSFTDFRFTVNFVTWIGHILSVAVNVFMHFGPGERYIGIPGFLIIPFTLVYAGITIHYGGGILFAFVPQYILMCITWRLHAIYRRKYLLRPVHTRYGGTPWLCFLMPRLDEILIKRVEPFIVIFAGAAVCFLNQALGLYLMIAGLGQAISVAVALMIEHAKELDRMDNMLEQQQLAERSRDLLGR